MPNRCSEIVFPYKHTNNCLGQIRFYLWCLTLEGVVISNTTKIVEFSLVDGITSNPPNLVQFPNSAGNTPQLPLSPNPLPFFVSAK